MGSNIKGKLGIGDKFLEKSSSPCLVEGLANVQCKFISCGHGHTIAIDINHVAYSWGTGEFGALGIDSTSDK